MPGVSEQIYQPSQSIGAATPLPGVSAAAYGSELGGAIEGAGGQLHETQIRAMRAEKQRQQESDNATAATGAAQRTLDLTQMAQAARDEAHLDGSGHVETVTAKADKIVGDYLSTITDPKVRERWSSHAAELRANLIGDEDGWARGKRIQSVKTNAVTAQQLQNNQLQENPDPHSLDAALKAGALFWDGANAPADVKAAGVREWNEGAAYNYAHGLNEKNPLAGLDVLHSGHLDQYLTPEHKKELVNEAQTNIRIAAADTRRVLTQQVSQLNQDTSEYKQRVDRGELPTDEETQKLVARATALGQSQVVDDIQYSSGKLKMSRETDKWTPAEWEAHVNPLAAEVAKGKASAHDQMQLRILQELRPAKEQRFHSDPEGFAAASGIQAPQVDLSNPDPGTVNARKSWAKAFAGPAGLIEPPYLSKDQLQIYRDRANQGPVGQLEVAQELKNTWGMDAAPSIVRQIGGEAKGEMQIMLGLNVRMAQVYGRGQQALDKKVVKLDDKIVSKVWQQYASGVPADVAPALLDTARKIAAGWMLEQGKTEPTADFENVFRQAVHRAAGMLGSAGGGSATGGFANWNGRFAWLPQDMSRDDLQKRISRAAPTDWAKAAVDELGNPTNAMPHHLGSDGKPKPYTKGEATRFGGGTLVTVAPGIYHLVDPVGGTVVDHSGRPWQFDVRRLPRGHFGGAR